MLCSIFCLLNLITALLAPEYGCPLVTKFADVFILFVLLFYALALVILKRFITKGLVLAWVNEL